ncbi:preprotein translocase subunit SecE [Marinicella sp. W31]|uniref:preprotein translocase subunit SecE n=1 Tax=Marinicella sp. W31 TaxID=3023713 RepID=UPI003758149D
MSQADIQHSVGEKLRWWLAIAVVTAAVAASIYYSDQLVGIFQALIVIGGLLLGAVIGSTTEKGKNFFKFVKQANIERQKIVWPTKNETLQTTLVVIVIVIIFGVFLFLVDLLFSNLVEYFFS